MWRVLWYLLGGGSRDDGDIRGMDSQRRITGGQIAMAEIVTRERVTIKLYGVSNASYFTSDPTLS